MTRPFVVVVIVCLAAGSPAASASDAQVDALLRTAKGAPRDFTSEERAAAVADLAGRARAGDVAAVGALVDLIDSEQQAAALAALANVKGDGAGRAFVDVIARLDVKNADNAGRATTLCNLAAGTRSPLVVAAIVRVVDDGATKELRIDALRALGRMGGGPFDKGNGKGGDAATAALVRYVDHRVLSGAARDVLLDMRASEAPLTPLLVHNDPEVRALATRLLGGTTAPAIQSAVKSALVQQLKDAPDDKARARALRGLATEFCGDAPYGKSDEPCAPAAGKQLAALVVPHLQNTHIGDTAIDAVKRVRDVSLVPSLITALDHPSSSVRKKSAELLGKIGDKSARKALIKKLDQTPLAGNWRELDGYMHGLVGCGIDVDDAPFFAAFLGRKDIASTTFSWNHPQMWQQLGRLPPSSSKAFLPLLRNPSRDTRKAIAKLLGQLGSAGSAVALLDVIEENGDIEHDAAAALGACADAAALPRMGKILDDRLKKAPWVGGGGLALAFVRADRANGLERTLSLIGKQGLVGIELLRALLKETHPSDARAFAHAFQQKSPDASTTSTYRSLAISGWARIDTPASIETLCGIATTHADSDVRKLAAVELKRFPEPRAVGCMVAALHKARGDGDADEIVRALVKATGEELTDRKAWDVFVRGGFGVGGGEEELKKQLSSLNASARALAASQLGKQKEALPSLLLALPSESSTEARLAILTAIAAHDSESSKKPLVDELERKRSSWPERIVIAKALDRVGEGRGTLELLKLADGNDGDAAQKAMLALSEVTGEPPTSSPSSWRAWWKEHAERYRMPDR